MIALSRLCSLQPQLELFSMNSKCRKCRKQTNVSLKEVLSRKAQMKSVNIESSCKWTLLHFCIIIVSQYLLMVVLIFMSSLLSVFLCSVALQYYTAVKFLTFYLVNCSWGIKIMCFTDSDNYCMEFWNDFLSVFYVWLWRFYYYGLFLVRLKNQIIVPIRNCGNFMLHLCYFGIKHRLLNLLE